MPAPPEHAVAESHIIARVHASVLDVDPQAWNALLAQQAHATPFMRHEYLAALETSGSATPRTGWTPRFLTLWDAGVLVAACPLYLKTHSYGEYVFDWAWASAYEQHGVPYYPKALVAVPFTLCREPACWRVMPPRGHSWCRLHASGAWKKISRHCTCCLQPTRTLPPAPTRA